MDVDDRTAELRTRVWPVWRRIIGLSWPVTVEQFLRTSMRTTDVVVAGFFSPAAVAAVGLADIFARMPGRFGRGIGDAAIARSSQDTGSGAVANRDEAVSQALLIGAIVGLPFVAFGLFLAEWAIGVMGAQPGVVAFGAAYLTVVLASTPARLATAIAARSIQGTGDTRTPMVINGAANLYNILATVVLAFGLGPAPALSLVGIAAATASADVLGAIAYLGVIAGRRRDLQLVVPTRPVGARQLVRIAMPRFGEGIASFAADFPFNALLLLFGTEVVAAYHIGERLYHQVSAPLSRGYSVASGIVVGQALGRGDPDGAYFSGLAAAALAFVTVGGLAVALFAGAEWFVRLFTRDAATLAYGTDFARAFAVATLAIAPYLSIAGALRGGSETRWPFVARTSGTIFFLLGTTYVVGVRLGVGVAAAYVAIVADFAWRALLVGYFYSRGRWMDRGTSMMYDRGSLVDQD